MADVIQVVPTARYEQGGLPNTAVSPAYEASRIVKVGGGVVYGVAGYNSKTSAQFILLIDGQSLTGTGIGLTLLPIPVAASSSFSVDFGLYGLPFTSGLVVCNSSTSPTFTAGSADVFYNVRFL